MEPSASEASALRGAGRRWSLSHRGARAALRHASAAPIRPDKSRFIQRARRSRAAGALIHRRSFSWWRRHDPARIRQSSAKSSGVTPSGNWMRLDESGKFWTNGRTSGSIARFCPSSLPVWRPGLSILPPLTGDEVRQTVRRQPAFAELTAPRGDSRRRRGKRSPLLSRPFGAGFLHEPPRAAYAV